MWLAIDRLDRQVLQWMTSFRLEPLDLASTWFAAAGGGALLWLSLAVVSFVRRQDRAAAWRVVLTVGLAYLVAGVTLKPLVGRPRPAPPAAAATRIADAEARSPLARTLPPTPSSYSFPSDRTTAAFGAAVAVSRMWPQGTAVWWTLAVLIGLERMYVGHHYPTDVLAGAGIGVLLAIWVLGGRHPATYASTVPRALPVATVIRP